MKLKEALERYSHRTQYVLKTNNQTYIVVSDGQLYPFSLDGGPDFTVVLAQLKDTQNPYMSLDFDSLKHNEVELHE